MPHKLVHPHNCPSVNVKKGSGFEIAISKVRKSLDLILSNGAPQVLANYALQVVNDAKANKVALSRLLGALLNETPISKALVGIDPFDKQNILTFALSDYKFSSRYVMDVSPVHERNSDPSDAPTHRIKRSTPCPKDFINR